MNIFEALWANRPLVCAASAWLLAQVIKFVLYSFIEKTISWRRLWGSGGMPSSHTAFTLALALSVGLTEHEGALTAERDMGIGTDAGVGMLRPRSPDGGCGEHAGLVGRPACAARRDHPVGAVVAEDGGCLVVACWCHAGVAARMVQVVGRQLGDVQGQVFLGCEDMIGLPVVVDKEGHVARHLSALKVAMDEETLGDGLCPLRRPPLRVVGHLELPRMADVLRGELLRPLAGIGTTAVEEGVRPLRPVAHGHAKAGSLVAAMEQLQMEPHDKLARRSIIDDLRPLHDAALLDVAALLLAHAEGHAAILPVHEVGRAIARHAHQRGTGILGLVLAKPVVDAVVQQHAAPVGVDVPSVGVGPQLSRLNRLMHGRSGGPEGQRRSN